MTDHAPDPDLGIDVATAPELDDAELGAVLEALLLVVDTPVTVEALAAATEHLHELMVSVPEQAKQLLSLLEKRGTGQWASFSELVADCGAPIEIVGRFLALLELYRSRAVAFDQLEPLGVLQVSWTGERPTSEDLLTTDSLQAQEVRDHL